MKADTSDFGWLVLMLERFSKIPDEILIKMARTYFSMVDNSANCVVGVPAHLIVSRVQKCYRACLCHTIHLL